MWCMRTINNVYIQSSGGVRRRGISESLMHRVRTSLVEQLREVHRCRYWLEDHCESLLDGAEDREHA